MGIGDEWMSFINFNIFLFLFLLCTLRDGIFKNYCTASSFRGYISQI